MKNLFYAFSLIIVRSFHLKKETFLSKHHNVWVGNDVYFKMDL